MIEVNGIATIITVAELARTHGMKMDPLMVEQYGRAFLAYLIESGAMELKAPCDWHDFLKSFIEKEKNRWPAQSSK